MFQKNKYKDIDLLSVYHKRREPSPHEKLLKLFLFPLVSSVILLFIFGFKTYSNHKLNQSITEMTLETQELQGKNEADFSRELYQSYQIVKNKVDTYTKLQEDLSSYPQISQESFYQIVIAAMELVDVSALSYVWESQVITLQIEAAEASNTEKFVRRLKQSEVFSDVQYSGYTQTTRNEVVSPEVDNTDTTPKSSSITVYTATVLCTLK